MGPTHHTQAVVDRIVDDQAVLLLEDDGETDELIVSVTDLPKQAREDGGVLTVAIEDGQVRSITSDTEATNDRRQRIRDKLDRLSRPLSEEDDAE